MPKYQITAPDGNTYEITAPEGATESQVLEYAKQNYKPTEVAAQTPTIGSQLARQAALTGRTIIETASSPINALADFISGAYNVGANLIGSTSRLPSLSQAQQQALTQMGLPKPTTTAEKVAQGGISAMLGTAGTAAAAPGTALSANLAQQIPAAAAAGAVAQPAAEATQELTGSETAATAASLIAATLAAGGVGKLAGNIAQGKVAPVTIDEIKQRAQRSYTAMEDAGVSVKPQSALNAVDTIKRNLEKANYLPQDPTQAKVGTILNRFEEIIGQQRVPFTKLEQMRSLANDVKASPDPNMRRLGGVMVNSLDDYIANLTGKDVIAGKGNLDEAVKNVMNARKDWRNLSRATVLEDVLNVAEARAANPRASESELIRQGFINLTANKNKMRMFSEAEQNAIKSVASGGPLDNLLSLVGGFNPFRSKLAAGSSLFVATQSPAAAAAIGLAGMSADEVQKILRQRAAQQALTGMLTGTTAPPLTNYSWRGLFSGGINPVEPQQ